MLRLLVLMSLAIIGTSQAIALTPDDAQGRTQALRWLQSRTQVAYSLGGCLSGCQVRYDRCVAEARNRTDVRECKLQLSDCQAGCNRFSP